MNKRFQNYFDDQRAAATLSDGWTELSEHEVQLVTMKAIVQLYNLFDRQRRTLVLLSLWSGVVNRPGKPIRKHNPHRTPGSRPAAERAKQ